MVAPDKFAAELLTTSASGYAAATAHALLDQLPDAQDRYGADALRVWKSHLTQRILELAAAVSVGEPGLFVARVQWAREAFGARKMPEADLRLSLLCLEEEFEEALPEPCRDSAQACIARAVEALDNPPDVDQSGLDPRTPEGKLAATYLHEVLEGRPRDAMEAVLNAVCHHGVETREAYLSVLLPALREVGRLWHVGELSIPEEHFVTSTTLKLMSLLAWQAEAAPPNGRTVIAAAVAGNAHDIGVRVLSDFLEMAGWRSVCLGADVPAEGVVGAAGYFDADLITLSATLTTQIPAVESAIRAVKSTDGARARILVGGLAFAQAPDIWKLLGADGYASNFDEAVAMADKLTAH